ncbi:MAG: cation:proton antiporter [Anaerolineae bacterium]
MQAELGLAIFAILIAVYGGVGILLGRWSITMPMVFVVIGAVLGPSGIGLLQMSPSSEGIRTLAESTLVILLFADASTLSYRRVESDAMLPARLLGIGFILTLVLGAALAFVLFAGQGVGFALLIAAILAPTDAALGLPIFTNPKVPVRIRRALNVESGLNDGLATPFVTLFLSLAVAEESVGQNHWLLGAAEQIGIAVLVGVVIGVVGGRFLSYTYRRGWTMGSPLQVAVFALALASYLVSVGLGGNGFVAAFVGGIAFGAGSRGQLAEFTEFSETVGTVLSLGVWALFGAVFVVPAALGNLDPRVILYALLSLTLIRMLPVFLALYGLHLRVDTRLLMGWFGPRGLASVVFGLLAFEELRQAQTEAGLLASVVTWTILLSVLAHGLSAQPLAAWYARRLAAAGKDLPELEDVPEVLPRQNLLAGITLNE